MNSDVGAEEEREIDRPRGRGREEKRQREREICLDDKKETKSTKVSSTRGPQRHKNIYPAWYNNKHTYRETSAANQKPLVEACMWTRDALHPAYIQVYSKCTRSSSVKCGLKWGQNRTLLLEADLNKHTYLVRNISAGSMLTAAIRPTCLISLAIIRSFSKFTRPSTFESLPKERWDGFKLKWYWLHQAMWTSKLY